MKNNQAWRTAGDGAAQLIRALFAGDATALSETIGEGVRLDTPRFTPAQSAEELAATAEKWPGEYKLQLESADVHKVTESEAGIVTEIRTTLSGGERPIKLPIAVVESPDDDQTLVRLYHSERLLTGERRGRRPIWPAEEGAEPTPLEEIHPAVASYMGAIAGGDPAAVLARLAPSGVMDNGVRPVQDHAELESIFRAMVRTGGARLVVRRQFDDGGTVALEYTGLPRPASPGQAPRTPPGGGIGIYQYDPDGRIEAVRMYDDFDPDALIHAGSEPRQEV